MGAGVDGTPLVASYSAPMGYTPATIRSYLGLSGTGSGQTIAIVDAYDDPNIAADLAKFDSTFGLPAPASFKKVTQTGATTGYPATDATWALEIALDVEWAHAVAPAASILLVEAKTATFADMDTAIAYAAKQTAVTVISNSWGATEFSGETTLDSYCKQSAKLCVFATGDYGNPGTYPAYSPYVLAVGGTSLNLASDGTVSSETAWGYSGGGVSLYESKPSFQGGTATKRGTPDVSFDGDPATGFAVYDSVPYSGQSGWFQMGGTSAGAPQWAAIVAVADQLRKAAGKAVLSGTSSKSLFMANSDIYGLTTGFADITTGPTNGTCGAICTPGTGFDFVTGRGSPRKGIDLALKAAP
jgi:subtilase family serine protease